ncbi:Protein of unknown function [Cotesia congregata]|uniref:Uncharacterized protein n=1 Tax=Cotesia congregata TaxID=51543 RepID=A0A8J2EC13_COTCN|nr:Protein of unknown function [Cotesia congregata]
MEGSKINLKIWKISLSSILFIVLILLCFLLFGYSRYDSYEGVRRNQGDLNEPKKASDILKEPQEKTRLYFQHPISTFDYKNDDLDSYDTDRNIGINSHSIGRFKRDASRGSTQQKQSIVKGKRIGKRQVFRGNAVTDCFQLREECLYMINFINSNLKVAEIALANIQNVIWRIQPLDVNTRSLLTCLQCSHTQNIHGVPRPTSGSGGNLEGSSSVKQPVLCSHFPAHIPPNDFQEKYDHRDFGQQNNKEADPNGLPRFN